MLPKNKVRETDARVVTAEILNVLRCIVNALEKDFFARDAIVPAVRITRIVKYVN